MEITFRNKLFWAIALLAVPLGAQNTSFSFSYAGSGTSAVSVSPGGTIQLPVTAVGASSSVNVVVTSSQTSDWSIQDVGTAGSGFTASGMGTAVPAGGQASLAVVMTPPGAGTLNGSLTVRLSGPNGQTFLATFNLSGIAVQGILTSYIQNPSGNQTLVVDNGVLPFASTAVGSTGSDTFVVSNQTQNTVNVTAIVLSGSAFQLSGLPLLPVAIVPGGETRFSVTFAPMAPQNYTGTLSISMGGQAQSFSLTGQGSAAVFSYQMTTGGGAAIALTPGATVAMGSTGVNTTGVTATVQFSNTGNIAGVIDGINTGNINFTIPSLPAFPLTVPAGGSVSFTVVFAPTQAGNISTTLRIGNAIFALTGTGLGPNLSVSLLVGGQVTAISQGGTATLPNTNVGASLAFTLVIGNTGNQAGSLASLVLTGTGFALSQMPALPAQIAPGGSLQVAAVFAPSYTGISNGTLQFGTQTVSLVGNAGAPPALPAVSFTNVSAQMQPAQQPGLGLQLAAPYPYDLTGRLLLSFVPTNYGDDPSIIFMNGTRYADFTIPAGSTNALFANGAQQAIFQTGTTAGTISLTADFFLGTYDLTAAGAPSQSIVIPSEAPVIQSVVIGSQSAAGFTLLITGFATPRSVTQLSFTLQPAKGSTVQTTTLTAAVQPSFDTWFQSVAGGSFGSQFTLSIQFNVSGAISAIQSVSVTASNGVGQSAPAAVALN